MSRIIFATGNTDKMAEIREILKDLGMEILSMKEAGVNPEIVETSGSQTGVEGCLSVPGKCGQVTRPDHVVVRALNEEMEPVEITGDGLLARCICHECDHLKGSLYVDLVEGELMDQDAEAAEDEGI